MAFEINPTALMILGGALAQADSQPRFNHSAMNTLASGFGAYPQLFQNYQKTQNEALAKQTEMMLHKAQIEQKQRENQAASALSATFGGGQGDGGAGMPSSPMSPQGQPMMNQGGSLSGQQMVNSMGAGGQPSRPSNSTAPGRNISDQRMALWAQIDPTGAMKSQMEKMNANKPTVMKPGESLVDPMTGQIITGFAPDPTAISPGQTLINPRTGQIMGQAPHAPMSLSGEQRAVDPNTGTTITPQVTSPVQDYTRKLQTILTKPGIDENTRQRAMLSLQQMKDSGLAAPAGKSSSGAVGAGANMSIGGRPLTPYDKSFMEAQGTADVKRYAEASSDLDKRLDFIRQSKGVLADYSSALNAGGIKGGSISGRTAPIIEGAKSQMNMPNKAKEYGLIEQYSAIDQLKTAQELMEKTGAITEGERAIAKNASISSTDPIEVQKYKIQRIQTLNAAIEDAAAARSKWEEMTAVKNSLGQVVAPGSLAKKINNKSFSDYTREIYKHHLGTDDPAVFLSGKK